MSNKRKWKEEDANIFWDDRNSGTIAQDEQVITVITCRNMCPSYNVQKEDTRNVYMFSICYSVALRQAQP